MIGGLNLQEVCCMEVELKTEGSAKTLNSAVAITVVIISVFMAVSKVKDDNIVQAMQASKAESVDRWNEYQADKLKFLIAEQGLRLSKTFPTTAPDAAAQIAQFQSDMDHYQANTKTDAEKAKAAEANYDALNVHDDQFDMSDAGLAIALSLAAVSALTSLWWLLGVSWVFAACGLVMGVAGFLGWNLHPDWIASLLG